MSFLKRLDVKRYYRYKDQVIKRNMIASQTYLLVGTIVATVNMLSNVFIKQTNGYTGSLVLLVYFVVASILRKPILKNHEKYSTLFLYIVQIPIMIFGILMGTVLDKTGITITFFLLLICMPPFILDNPVRHLIYIISMMILYIILGYTYKVPEIFKLDMVHALSFMMGSMFVNLFVLAERFDNIENYVLSDYRSRHDEITGLKNRYSLRQDSVKYTNMHICAAIVDIDYFKFFNDMYGHDFGEEIVAYIGSLSRDVFGEEYCYRFESDEIIILDDKSSEAEFKRKLKQISDGFSEIVIRGKKFHPTCSIAYVYGNTEGEGDVAELIRHTDVRLLETRAKGRGSIMGYSYDRSQKRQTDILAEVAQTNTSSSIDEITGIPNMQFFRIRADEMLGNVLNLDKEPVILYFNLGNFKAYNEEYGFRKGDKLLRDIGQILKDEFSNRVIARFAEDHFVVLCYKSEAEEIIPNVFQKVKPLFGSIHMNIKVGIAQYVEGENVGITCDKAKLACDSIKHDSNRNFVYYSEQLETRNKLERYVISHVDEAAEKGYLRVYYQPVIDIKTGKLIELEALARWIDPIHGFLAPGDFIPPLEEAKLIHKVDGFIARQVCLDQPKLRDMAGMDIPVSINLSRLDFMLTNIVDSMKDIVKKNQVDTKNLHIEVTESALENDSEELKDKMNELREAGFEIWLDDFGSGYSSLNSLQDFTFDVIKVDMKFMRTLESNPQTSIIVKSIIEMTKSLNLRSLVEGVETQTQYDFINEIGVDMAQGFLFSRPVPIDDLKFN